MVRRFLAAGSAGRVFSADVLDQLAPATSVVATGSKTWFPNGDAGAYTCGISADTPTLSIADNGDGTGAVATIAGSSDGVTNTIYVSDWPLTTFVSGGSRDGDGTAALSLSNGPHLAYVISTLDVAVAVSNLVHFRTTDTSQAILTECLNAVRDLILGLSLAGLDVDNVLVRKLPWNREAIDEGVFISPAPERYGRGTNARDDVGYGVMVSMIKKSNQDLTGSIDAFLVWRQEISKALRRGSSTLGVSEVYDLSIEPAAVYLPDAFTKQYDVGAVVVRCLSREPLTV